MANEIIKEIKENASEVLAAFCILTLLLLMLALKRGYFISTIGGVLILLIALERRGSHFDRFVSMTVVFFLAISFMFL